MANKVYTRTIVWRPIQTAPKDGRLIEVAWLAASETRRLGPKRTRWLEGKWMGNYTPDHWRPIGRG